MLDLKERIRSLENAPIIQDAQLRNNRVSLNSETLLSILTLCFKIKVLRKKFLEAIEDYQREEQDSRLRSRQRVERQLKIGKPRNRFVNVLQFTFTLVKPDATPEELAVAVDGGGQQVFAQAVSKYFCIYTKCCLVLTAAVNCLHSIWGVSGGISRSTGTTP
jgi:syntaxin 1B/2/3